MIMGAYLISLVNIIFLLLTVLIIAKVLLSYFVDPYQPIRIWIDRLVEPMLRPIRRVVPPVGMVDLSPIILIVIVQIVGRLIISILATVFH